MAGIYRVVVWATGGIGSIAIRTIARRPDLDLVGVWVHSPDKVGRDAGELANGEPIGLAATDDADATVAAVRGHGGSVLVEPMEIPGRSVTPSRAYVWALIAAWISSATAKPSMPGMRASSRTRR